LFACHPLLILTSSSLIALVDLRVLAVYHDVSPQQLMSLRVIGQELERAKLQTCVSLFNGVVACLSSIRASGRFLLVARCRAACCLVAMVVAYAPCALQGAPQHSDAWLRADFLACC
jgi:hypothetical protein